MAASSIARRVAALLWLGGCEGNPVEALPTFEGSSSETGGTGRLPDDATTGTTTAPGGLEAGNIPDVAGPDGTDDTTTGAAAACGDGVRAPGEWCWGDALAVPTAGTIDVAACDVDGDGVRDLVVANAQGLTPFGQDDGVWTARPRTDVAAQLVAIRCGALDMDSHADVVAIDTNYGLWSAFGSDAGLDSPTQTYLSDNAGALGMGDVDADGHQDVVVASAMYGSLVYYVGSSTGALSYLTATNIGYQTTSMVLADLDGDARQDAIMSTLVPSLEVARFNPATPTLPTLASYPSPSGRGGLTAADLDGDGLVDIARIDLGTGTLRLWHGDGGSLTDTVDIPVTTIAHGLGASDFDADGDVDLVVLGDGQLIGLDNQGEVHFEPRDPIAVDGALGVRLDDLDGDGAADLVVFGPPGLGVILVEF